MGVGTLCCIDLQVPELGSPRENCRSTVVVCSTRIVTVVGKAWFLSHALKSTWESADLFSVSGLCTIL